MKSETGYELITSLIAQLIFHYWPWIIDFYLCYVNVLVYATLIVKGCVYQISSLVTNVCYLFHSYVLCERRYMMLKGISYFH